MRFEIRTHLETTLPCYVYLFQVVLLTGFRLASVEQLSLHIGKASIISYVKLIGTRWSRVLFSVLEVLSPGPGTGPYCLLPT